MNTYLISIFSNRLLEEEINKITDNKENIININYDDSNIEDVINECSYFSLLNEEKIVIVKNFKINASSKKIESYLDNPNPNTILLLIIDSIDKRSTIYKKIKQKGHIIEISELKPNELSSKVNNYCKNNGISINYNSINKLLDYNNNNYDLVLNEIDKIKITTNEINEEIIDKYCSNLDGDNTFELCDAIVSKKYQNISKLLNGYINERKEIIPLITLLANQYRIIYTVKEINDTNDNIANLLKIHPYRVKLAKEKAYLYTKEELEDILLSLCELDKDLKSLNVNEYTLFRKFLIKITN